LEDLSRDIELNFQEEEGKRFCEGESGGKRKIQLQTKKSTMSNTIDSEMFSTLDSKG